MEYVNIADVNWRTDSITRQYVQENYAMIMYPGRMSARELATAATYCAGIDNPYTKELCRAAGLLKSFERAASDEERAAVLRETARRFRMTII